MNPPRRTTAFAPLALALAFAVCIATALVLGIVGGLTRAGVAWPASAAASSNTAGAWVGAATASHAALLIGGFLGTVIGIERAVAVRAWPAFIAPAASAAATVTLVAGSPATVPLAQALLIAAAAVFAAVNAVLLRRQPAAHTALLLVAALAWLVGNVMFARRGSGLATLGWWFTFLVLTIAAERLEMTRLMRRRPGALASFAVIVAALVAGAAASALPAPASAAGGVLFGAALVALAAWLALFDIARRTVRAEGLSRYMAICLLGGYAWLGVAGLAWAAMSASFTAVLGAGTLRDVALHALGLGFVLAMVMGHAPVILPAVARIKVLYGPWFYAPLALLHASLLWRFFGASLAPALDSRAQGAAGNALALVLFVATMAGSAWAWRRAHPARGDRSSRSNPATGATGATHTTHITDPAQAPRSPDRPSSSPARNP